MYKYRVMKCNKCLRKHEVDFNMEKCTSCGNKLI